MPINSVTVCGNLTRDPELKVLPSGSSVCELGVAVNERVKGSDGAWEDRPSFFDVSVFGKSAEACDRFLSKGRQVVIAGRLRQERWKSKEGDNRSKVRIVAQDVQFVGGREEGGVPSQGRRDDGWVGGGPVPQPPAPQPGGGGTVSRDDDIPFAFPVNRDERSHNHNEFVGEGI